jgi:hypothetical protein
MIRDWSPGRRLLLFALLAPAILLLVPATVPAQEADHLLLSEFCVVTRAQVTGSPFIEIVNPTGAAIALENVYLTNAQDASLDRFYWNIVTGAGQGGGTSGNFHARFPVGLEIAAGDTMVIALEGSADFAENYGYAPDLELYEDGIAPDAVAEMREAFPGSIGAGLGSGGANEPELSNGTGATDSIVLYRWNGTDDLVEDLDYVFYGTGTSVRVDKTGVVIDGPDAGETTSAYLDDTAAASQISAGAAPSFGQSLMRQDAVETDEPSSGGNGATGHDETGENLASSWQLNGAADPAGPAASPPVPAPIITAGSAADAYAGLPTDVSVTAVASDAIVAMTIHYRVDGGAWQTAAGSDQGSGTWQGAIPGQSGGVTLGWYVSVTGEGGGVGIWPAGADHLPIQAPVEGVPAPEITSATAAAAYTGLPCRVTVQVEAINQDLDGTLFWATAGGAFNEVALTADGTTLTGDIPGQPVGTSVEWYVEVRDSDEQSDVYPAGAPDTLEEIVFVDPAAAAAKLLITEIAYWPNDGEFVEIHNPNAFDVSLGSYYLTDAIYAPGEQYYWKIVEGDLSQGAIGGGDFGDFHGRFPDTAAIAAGDTITVALHGSDAFFEFFGVLPDYELYEDSDVADSIPDLVELFPGSTFAEDFLQFGVLTQSDYAGGRGEVMVLYYWNGQSDLVTDGDVVVWGNEETSHFTKNGVEIDGPDEDDEPSEYLPETLIGDQDPIRFTHEVGESFTRTSGEGNQITTGSNGVDGRDELSEPWNGTSEDDLATFAAATATPSPPRYDGPEPELTLQVPAATFIPEMGETFPITVSTLAGAETKLRIVDLEGRVVINLVDSRYISGRVSIDPSSPSQVSWDGRDQTYKRLPSGTYVIHLQAVNTTTGEIAVKTAPVVIATRLN